MTLELNRIRFISKHLIVGAVEWQVIDINLLSLRLRGDLKEMGIRLMKHHLPFETRARCAAGNFAETSFIFRHRDASSAVKRWYMVKLNELNGGEWCLLKRPHFQFVMTRFIALCGVEASLSDNITRRYPDPLRALQSQGALCLLSFILWVFSIGAAADRQRERWRR